MSHEAKAPIAGNRVLWRRHGSVDQRPRSIVPIGRVAHLVIDMQAGFLATGSVTEVPAARGIVENINRISNAIRQQGGVNVFVRFLIDHHTAASWPRFFEQFGGVGVRKLMVDSFGPGAPLFELWHELDVDEQRDLVLDKKRYSAFGGGSTLDATLRDQGVGTVIVSGTMSNCCCESTARDAMELNYRVLFGRDSNAARSPDLHDAAVGNICSHFGDAPGTQQILDVLRVHADRARHHAI